MSESWLILETSGRVGKVGLARGGAVVRAVNLDDTRRHARDLAATIEAVLKADPDVGKALSNEKLEAMFDLGYHLKQVDTIFRRVFG